MDLVFNQQGNEWVAEFEATADFNLHIEREKSVRHEYGHCIQSRILGPLYLLIVGLPSLIHAGFCRCVNHDYTDYWCEKWADKLGGVLR